MTSSIGDENSDMEIILLSPLPPPIGGVATWTESVLQFKRKTSININHINTSTNGILPTSSRLNPLIFLKRINTFLFVTGKLAIKKFFNKNNSIVHLCSSGQFGFCKDILVFLVAKTIGLKTIIHLHYGNFEIDYKRKKIINYLSKIVFYFSDRIITMDSGTYHFIKKNFSKNKVCLIRNGFNLKYEIKKNISFNKVIYVGRIEKEKGSYELINAFLNIRNNNDFGKLTLIGDCYDQVLIKKINSTKNVIWHGRRDKDFVIKALSESKCLCIPSYSEGMPFTVIEAMSMGIPVISSKAGGLIDLLGKNYPFFLESISKEDIIFKLKKLFTDTYLSNKISLYLNNRYKKYFTADKMMNELEKLWIQL